MFDRKSWNKNQRNFDVFDVKADVITTLRELGISGGDLYVGNRSKDYYHSGRSGSVKLNLKMVQSWHILVKFIRK